MQFCHFHAAIRARALPSPVGSAGHAVKELGGLYVAVFGVTIRLRVVAKAHLHRKKSGDDFLRIDASLCKHRPGVSRAFCGAQAGEPECFDRTARHAQKLAYAA